MYNFPQSQPQWVSNFRSFFTGSPSASRVTITKEKSR